MADDQGAALQALLSLNKLLKTGLDRESLILCVQLCEYDVNPEALAAIVKELSQESRGRPVAEAQAGSSLASPNATRNDNYLTPPSSIAAFSVNSRQSVGGYSHTGASSSG